MTNLFKLAAILALLVCGQALGQDPSIQFTVELGGNNNGANPPVTFPTFTPGSDLDGQTYDSNFTWDVVVEMTSATTANGIANVVFDLEVRQGTVDGPLVDVTFFSTVNDGSNASRPHKNAAFCSSMEVCQRGSYGGRVFDNCDSGGPYIDRIEYPSSATFPAGSTATAGTLVGMGCGYSKYTPSGPHQYYYENGEYTCDPEGICGACGYYGGDNVAGLGLLWSAEDTWPPGAVYGTWPGLGIVDGPRILQRPIAEGQIDMSDDPSGLYYIVLVPGKCNVLKNDFDPETWSTPGAFADAVPTEDVHGDTIAFYWDKGEELDWGDAPDSYQTLNASGGPSHVITNLILGATIDAEADGQPSIGAVDDDLNGAIPDDEDGVVIPVLQENRTDNIIVTASLPGLLDAWIDFNNNGVFDHPAEHLGAGVSIAVVAGPNNIPVTPAVGTAGTGLYARFRLSTAGNLLPGGSALDGEVEDYNAVEIEPGGCTVPPTILEAKSWRTHNTSPTQDFGVDLLTDLVPTGGGPYEMRCGSYNAGTQTIIDPGPDWVTIVFDMAVTAYDGTLDTEVSFSVGTTDSISLATTYLANDTLVVDASGFSDRVCETMTISGIACADNPQPSGVMPDTDIEFAILVGNSQDADIRVNLNDALLAKGFWNQTTNAANFKCDVWPDGRVNLNDALVMKANWNLTASCP